MKTILLPYLRLLRFPAVFTAMADIFLGYLLVVGELAPLAKFLPLLLASSAIYLAGMVFNDVFDRKVDAEERPNRPIPSGAVSLRSAVILGIVLFVVGMSSAVFGGVTSLFVAGLLILVVLGYDGGLKQTPLGPVAMGACRFLNVLLGASAGLELSQLWMLPHNQVATGLGTYIVGVTWFARNEAKVSSRGQLLGAIGIINLGLAILFAFILNWEPGASRMHLTLLLLGVIAFTIDRRLIYTVSDPVPQRVQATVKTLLMSLVTLDATLILFATGDVTYALMTIALLFPAFLIGRWIAVT